ncbi:matrix protein [Malakal virus]|uniref:Matrix protein n=1 Tax=Malakal virus TaxID=1229186 RepID=J9UF68_9RHAB|nr:matrix protein [Malakal virus]AFR67110.1 matrix protein [Malakal virus]
MRSLFKKGKSKGSAGTRSIASSEEGDPMLIWGTAPPYYGEDYKYEDLNDGLDMEFLTKSYLISVNLDITTNRPVERTSDMLHILEVMVDEYDGSYLSKPLIISSYLAVGTHLRRLPTSVKNNNRYSNGFTEIVEFTGEKDIHPRDLEIKYNKFLSTMYQGEGVSISFQFSCKRSKRKGKNIIDAYELELSNGSKPPDFKYSLEPYDIVLTRDAKGNIGFKKAMN